MTVISFALGAAGQAISTLAGVAEAFGATEEAIRGFDTAARVADGTIRTLTAAFAMFIGQNDQMNQQLLRSQALLSSNARLFTQYGDPITDIKEGLRASRDQLREVLKDIEKDSEALVGVTSAQVNETFGFVMRNVGDLVGQSKKAPPLEAMQKLAVGLAAAGGVQGLPTEMLAQEVRALASGDVNNPDAQIARSLGINKEDYARETAKGTWIDFLLEKLNPSVLANAEAAATSISGVASNIEDFFQRVTRTAGESAMQPLLDGLNELYEYLKDNEGAIQSGMASALEKVLGMMMSIAGAARVVVEALRPAVTIGFQIASSLSGGFLDGWTALISAVTSGAQAILNALKPIRDLINDPKFLELIANPVQTVKDVAANNLNPFRVGANIVQGKPLGQTAAQDATVAYEELKANTDRLLESVPTNESDRAAKISSLAESQGTSGGRRQRRELTGNIKLLEEQLKNLEDVELFSGEQREAQQKYIQETRQGIELLKEEAAAAGVAIDDGIEIRGKQLADRGQLAEKTVSSLKSQADRIADLVANGGNQKDFDQLSEKYVKGVSDAVELGAVTREQAIESLRVILNTTQVSLETRSAAHKQIMGYLKEQSDAQKAVLDVDIAASRRMVAQGSQSAETGALQVKQAELTKLNIDRDSVSQQIEDTKKLGLSTRGLETRLKLINEQVAAGQAELGDLDSARVLADVDRATKRANSLIAGRSAQRALIAAREESKGVTRQEDETLSKLDRDFQSNAEQRAIAQQRLNELLAVPEPNSQASRLKLEEQRLDARKQLITLTEQGIRLEMQYRDAAAAADIASAMRDNDRANRRIDENAARRNLDRSREASGLYSDENAKRSTEDDLRTTNEQLREQAKLLVNLGRARRANSPEERDKAEATRSAARVKMYQLEAKQIELTTKAADQLTESSIAAAQREQRELSAEEELKALNRGGDRRQRIRDSAELSEEATQIRVQGELGDTQARLRIAEKFYKDLHGIEEPISKEARDRLAQQRQAAYNDLLKYRDRIAELQGSVADTSVAVQVAQAQQTQDRVVQAAERRFQNQRTDSIRRVVSGAQTQGDAQRELARNEVALVNQRVEAQKRYLQTLQSIDVRGASAELRESVRQRQQKATLELARLEEQSLTKQLQIRDAEINQQLKLRSLQLERRGLRSEELSLEERASRVMTSALNDEIELQQQLRSLSESRLALEVARRTAIVGSFKEALKLFDVEEKARKEKNQTLIDEVTRQKGELGVASNEGRPEIATQLLKQEIKLAEAQLNAAQKRFEFDRQSLLMEQERTRQTLEQEKIAARRAVVESAMKVEELKLRREEVKSDRGLTSEERDAQLSIVDRQLELASVANAFDRGNVAYLESKDARLSQSQMLQRSALSAQQSTEAVNTQYQLESGLRQSRLSAAELGVNTLGINPSLSELKAATGGSAPVVATPPELLSAIRQLNGLLERQQNAGPARPPVTVVNNYPDIGLNRASDRLKGY